MAIVPVYCPEDPGGPLSQKEALGLVELQRQRAMEYGTDSAMMEQALRFAADLIERLVPDPRNARRALEEAADRIEQTAAELRSRAADGEMEDEKPASPPEVGPASERQRFE